MGVSRQWIVQIEGGKPGTEVGRLIRVLDVLDLVLRLEARPDDPLEILPIRGET